MYSKCPKSKQEPCEEEIEENWGNYYGYCCSYDGAGDGEHFKVHASFMLVILSFTKDAADPLDVAIIATIPHATASLTGMPSKTKMGVRMLAPPSLLGSQLTQRE